MERTLEPKFCSAFWFNLELRADGTVAPCCRYRGSLNEPNGSALSTRTTSLSEIYASQQLKELRNLSLKGRWAEGCEACQKSEKLGLKSRRQAYNSTFVNRLQDIGSEEARFEQPIRVDLKLSNRCNLRCRICGPESSTEWEREIGGSQTLFEPPPNVEILEQLVRWLPNLEVIELYGGESFLISENFELIMNAIRIGVSKSQTVVFSTNGTALPELALRSLIPSFSSVQVAVSIDGTNEQFNYQRFPAKYESVIRNFEKLKRLQSDFSNLSVWAALTVSAINVFYLPEYFEEFRRKKIDVRMQVLSYPRFFGLSVFPSSVRDTINEKLYGSINFDRMDQYDKMLLKAVKRVSSADSHLWPCYIKMLKERDIIRNQNYEKTFQEFSELWNLA